MNQSSISRFFKKGNRRRRTRQQPAIKRFARFFKACGVRLSLSAAAVPLLMAFLHKVTPGFLIVFVLSLALWVTPHAAPLRESEANLLQLLATLGFSALVLERSLEVFVKTIRGPEMDRQNLEMQWQKEEVARLKKLEGDPKDKERELNAAMGQLKQMKRDLIAYKCRTQQMVLWLGTVLGMLISAVGIRTLQALLEPGALASLSGAQVGAFHVVDVLITGGLLAGGSEGIHKVAQVFTNFMETSAESVKSETTPLLHHSKA